MKARNRIQSAVLASFVVVTLSIGSASAGLISIGTGPLSSTGDEILATGTQVFAWNVGSDASPAAAVVNGITFADTKPTTVALNNPGGGTNVNVATTSVDYTTEGMQAIMGDLSVSAGGVTMTVTLSDLTIGQDYRLQMFHHQHIDGANKRRTTVYFGNQATGTSSGVMDAGLSQGYISTTIFKADATTQLFTFVTLSGSTRSVINGATLFEMPAPAPTPVDYTWTGGATDSNLATAGNYSPSFSGANNNDTFTFDGTQAGDLSLSLAAPIAFYPYTGIGNISLTSAQTAAVSINSTVASGSAGIRIAEAAGVSMANGSGPLTLDATITGGLNIALGANDSTIFHFTNNNATGGSALTIGSKATISPGGAGAIRNMAFQGTGDFVINAPITGAIGLTKTGTGNLTLAGNNTYTGNVTLTGGTLKAGSNTALGAIVGGTTISGGATLDINSMNLGAEIVTIAGSGVAGNGAIVNSGALQTSALRFVTLSADASIGGTGRWDIRGSAITAGVLDLGNYKLTKTGSNNIVCGFTTVTPGDIDVNEGTLSFFDATTSVQGAGTITVNNGGTLEIGYGISAGNITRDIVLNGGILGSKSTASIADSNIQLKAATTLKIAGTLTLKGNLTETGGAHTLVMTAGNTLILEGTSGNRTGETIIDHGYLQVKNASQLGTGKITIGQTTIGDANHSLRLNGVTIVNDVDSQYSYTSDYLGAITAIGGTTSTITGDVTILPVIAGAGDRGGNLAADGTAGSVLRLMGELNVGGGQTVIFQRNGVVEYGGGSSTSYDLKFTGTARLAANNGIGSGVAVEIGNAGGSVLDLNGWDTTLQALTKAGYAATVTNSSATSDSTLTLSSSTNSTYVGVIQDGATNKVRLVKDGSSTFTLSGVNTYSGDTLVANGTLAGTGSANSPLTVQNGAKLAPGVSVGTFSSTTATFQSGSSFTVELDSSGSTTDLLSTYGNVSLASGVTLSVSDIAAIPATLTLGTELVIIDYYGYAHTGTFNGLPEGAEIIAGANKFLISYNNDSQVTLTANGSAGGFANWAAANGATGGTAGNPDNDGLSNLQEYAFGTNPTASTGAIDYAGAVLTTPGAPKLVAAGGAYSMVFGRRADYVAAGLTYTVQFSTDLNSWVNNNDGTNPPVQVATDGTINAMSVPYPDFITTPNGDQNPTFSRVKVELAP